MPTLFCGAFMSKKLTLEADYFGASHQNTSYYTVSCANFESFLAIERQILRQLGSSENWLELKIKPH
jgi:hypothetical protein